MSIQANKFYYADILSGYGLRMRSFSFEGSDQELIAKVAQARDIYNHVFTSIQNMETAIHPLSTPEAMRALFILQGEMTNFSTAIKVHTWMVKLNASLSMLSAAKKTLEQRPSELSSRRALNIYTQELATISEYAFRPDLTSEIKLSAYQTPLCIRLNQLYLLLKDLNLVL